MLDRARYRGALLGALIGDALGAPFEGHRGVVPEPAITSLLRDSSPLPFTDDTALTVALAESLLRAGGIDEDDLARGFAETWAAAPDLGYSTRTAALLGSIYAHGRQSTGRVQHGRASNGAAMRVAPIALWAAGRPLESTELARRSARVTHDHPGAIDGAVAQAVAVSVALRHPAGEPIDPQAFVATVRRAVSDPQLDAKLGLLPELATRGDAEEIARRVGVGLLSSQSVSAAICAFVCRPESFSDAVTLAISLGGDTDTIASMTGAVSGALLGEKSIPARWLDRTTIAPRVRQLADTLHTECLTARNS